MPANDSLVSIGLPVYNGAQSLERAVESVLAQDYGNIELMISDNASGDATEQICRHYAQCDQRVRYHRQPENIGQIGNFVHVLDLARGAYFKWLGDDDWLMPTYVSRCVQVLAEDERLILVTTQQGHVDHNGQTETASYTDQRLRSDRPVERFVEMLRLLNESYLLIDPLYSMMRRSQVAAMPRFSMLYEDEVYAARLALAGPFGHLPEVLSYRSFKPFGRLSQSALRYEVPPWHARAATVLQSRELLRCLAEADLDPGERREAQTAVAGMYFRRHAKTAVRRSRKLLALAMGGSTARGTAFSHSGRIRNRGG